MSDNDDRRFKVSLSFSGEHRDYMLNLAKCLHDRLNPRESEEKDGVVFYDFWFEAEINGLNAAEYLQTVYNKNSEIVVVGVAQQYDHKVWCQTEWDAIQALLFTLRPSKDPRDRLRVFYLRFDDAEVGGVWPNDGYTDARKRTPDQVADLILDRLKLIGETIVDKTPDWLKLVRKISDFVSRLVDYLVPTLLRKHPFLCVTVPLVAIALSLAWRWYLFIPSEVAIDYYNAIGQKEYERAWGHTADSFRTKRFSTLEAFKNLYGTTEPPTSMKAEPQQASLFDIFTLLSSDTRQVTLKYDMFERFTKEQLDQPFQKENRLWVQIYHKTDFPKLMDGTLEAPEGTGASSLAIRRYFEEAIVLKRENGEWKILSIQKTLRGLKRLTE